MALVLRNIDTDLFFCDGGWTSDPQGAQRFDDKESIERIAKEIGMEHAEATILEASVVLGGIFIRLSD